MEAYSESFQDTPRALPHQPLSIPPTPEWMTDLPTSAPTLIPTPNSSEFDLGFGVEEIPAHLLPSLFDETAMMIEMYEEEMEEAEDIYEMETQFIEFDAPYDGLPHTLPATLGLFDPALAFTGPDTVAQPSDAPVNEEEAVAEEEDGGIQRNNVTEETFETSSLPEILHNVLSETFLDGVTEFQDTISLNTQLRMVGLGVFESRTLALLIRPTGLFEDQLEALPRCMVRSPDELEHAHDEDRCSICYVDYVVEEELVRLPCTHRYHDTCIRRWLSANTSCPICRSHVHSYRGDDNMRIFIDTENVNRLGRLIARNSMAVDIELDNSSGEEADVETADESGLESGVDDVTTPTLMDEIQRTARRRRRAMVPVSEKMKKTTTMLYMDRK